MWDTGTQIRDLPAVAMGFCTCRYHSAHSFADGIRPEKSDNFGTESPTLGLPLFNPLVLAPAPAGVVALQAL